MLCRSSRDGLHFWHGMRRHIKFVKYLSTNVSKSQTFPQTCPLMFSHRGVYHWTCHQGHEQQLAPRVLLLWHLWDCACRCGVCQKCWQVSFPSYYRLNIIWWQLVKWMVSVHQTAESLTCFLENIGIFSSCDRIWDCALNFFWHP